MYNNKQKFNEVLDFKNNLNSIECKTSKITVFAEFMKAAENMML